MNARRMSKLLVLLLVVTTLVTACAQPTATPVPPTKAPVAAAPTAVPPTAVPPTKAPTAVPPTAVPPTKAPEPTKVVTPTATIAPTKTPLPALAAPTCAKMANALTPKAGELGAADKPIVITFVPSGDTANISRGGTALADCLGKMTGLTYKMEVGTSEAASIEAMGGGKAHMGFLNTFSILLAKEKYDVEVALVAQRKYGVLKADGAYTSFDFDPDKALAGQLTSYYKPEYFAKAGSGIKTLADVKGKSMCFTSAGSMSGGVVPRIVFKALGVDPDKDMKSTYAGGHDKAVIAVYNGDCDAGVAFMDALTSPSYKLTEKFPDLTQKVIVFAVGDRIPNDGLQYIKGLDPKIKEITTAALLDMMKDPKGNAVVKSIYDYDAFEVADYAKYYAPFNEIMKKAGVDVSKLVKQ